jgi:hypothetical protein
LIGKCTPKVVHEVGFACGADVIKDRFNARISSDLRLGIYSLCHGLNNSNSNYSGGFTGVNGGAGLGGFAASSSGGLTGGTSGLAPTGGVTAVGVSLGGGLLSGFSGGVTATNYTNPIQLGQLWPSVLPDEVRKGNALLPVKKNGEIAEDEIEIEFRSRSGKLLAAKDYFSPDGENGFSISKASWTLLGASSSTLPLTCPEDVRVSPSRKQAAMEPTLTIAPDLNLLET